MWKMRMTEALLGGWMTRNRERTRSRGLLVTYWGHSIVCETGIG
jgi:hypothetical protein